jgi:hypothetical protein
MISTRSIISKLIESCRDEQDIDKKIETLYHINSILPKSQKLKIPSLLTDDYVETDQSRLKMSCSRRKIAHGL